MFISTFELLNHIEEASDSSISFYNETDDGYVVYLKDDKTNGINVDEDMIEEIYGDDAAGGVEFVEGGVMIFPTYDDYETWKNQN